MFLIWLSQCDIIILRSIVSLLCVNIIHFAKRTMRYHGRNISDNCDILNFVSDISERSLFSEFSAYVSTHLPIPNLKFWKFAPPSPRCGTEFFSNCSPPLSAIIISHTMLGVTESSLWVTPHQECIVPPCPDGQRPVISTLALYAAYIYTTH